MGPVGRKARRRGGKAKKRGLLGYTDDCEQRVTVGAVSREPCV